MDAPKYKAGDVIIGSEANRPLVCKVIKATTTSPIRTYYELKILVWKDPQYNFKLYHWNIDSDYVDEKYELANDSWRILYGQPE